MNVCFDDHRLPLQTWHELLLRKICDRFKYRQSEPHQTFRNHNFCVVQNFNFTDDDNDDGSLKLIHKFVIKYNREPDLIDVQKKKKNSPDRQSI